MVSQETLSREKVEPSGADDTTIPLAFLADLVPLLVLLCRRSRHEQHSSGLQHKIRIDLSMLL
jgi:hypothetical protein